MSTHVCAGQFRTTADQRYTVLEMPFLGRTLSLQVVLPSERKTPLSSLETQLTARQVASWEFGLRRTKMDIFLPRLASNTRAFVFPLRLKDNFRFCFFFSCYRFKIQNKFNLRSVLPAMGISDAFNPATADFSGISGQYSDSVSFPGFLKRV